MVWKMIQYVIFMYPLSSWLERSINSSIESACAIGAAACIVWWIVSVPELLTAILTRRCNCVCAAGSAHS